MKMGGIQGLRACKAGMAVVVKEFCEQIGLVKTLNAMMAYDPIRS